VVRGEPSHTLVPGTALPGGRPSTSRPEFLSDDDSVLTRFEDEAQVFGYLTGRLNDSANRDPLTRRSPRGVRTIFQARFCHPVGNSEPPLLPRGERRGMMKFMRIALFVTCPADTLYPGVGRATVTLLERLGHQVEFPATPDVLRPNAREHRLPEGRAAAGPPIRRDVRSL